MYSPKALNSVPPFPVNYLSSLSRFQYIEDITRLREDMDFMFEWQEQYLTSERSE